MVHENRNFSKLAFFDLNDVLLLLSVKYNIVVSTYQMFYYENYPATILMGNFLIENSSKFSWIM